MKLIICSLFAIVACFWTTVPGRAQDRSSDQLSKELAELRTELKAFRADLEKSKRADRELKQAELKWAKGILLDFFQGIQQNITPGTLTLLSEDRQKEFRNDDRGWGYKKLVSVISEEILPDQDEAVFRGVMKDLNHTDGDDFDFVIRIARVRQVSPEKVWRIVYLLKIRREKK